jgi:putative tricarboxylic transport membrane protein
MLDSLVQGFGVIFDPMTFLYIALGTIGGVIVGAMPGMSASMAVVLGMTFSYALDPLPALAFLVAVYCSAITGGGITAILFSIPGTPSSATTTFDGYPMAMRGEAGKALGISLITSAIGGMFSAFCMFLLTPQLAAAALEFGPSELFAVSFLGLSILTCLDSGNVVKTVISGLMGLWLACIGLDPILGHMRFTFGITKLVAGIELIPVMIGLFAATEVLKQLRKRDELDLGKNASVSTKLTGLGLWGMKWTILRSAAIGTVVGILPGAGATIASFLSYAMEVKSSKTPENYGKGEPRGIAASETANNAATGGAMVPLLSLGIPGGNAAAVMATALAVKGVSMGPLLLTTQPVYMYATFASMVLTNITMVAVSVVIAKAFAKVLSVPYCYLGTLILLLSALGSFSGTKSTGDIILMAIAGILGLGFGKMGFNSAALVLGLVLGQMCEKNLRNAITLAKGDLVEVFIGKPITLVLIIACVVMLVYPLVKPTIMKKLGKDKADAKA